MQGKSNFFKAAIIFVIVAFLLLLIFYVFPARIFEAEVITYFGEYKKDLALRQIFFHKDLPESVVPETVVSIYPTIKGGLIMLACFFGLPFMIAWRTIVTKHRPERQRDDSEFDEMGSEGVGAEGFDDYEEEEFG